MEHALGVRLIGLFIAGWALVANSTTSIFCEERSAIESHFQLLQADANVKTIFLFSIGGGSDTFSGLIPSIYLRHLGFKVFHFGVLSPTAHHFQKNGAVDQPEDTILRPSTDLQRALLTRPPLLIGNVEVQLEDFASSLPHFDPDTSFLLSAKQSPNHMAAELTRFIDQRLMELGQDRENALIVAADFGADILSQGEASTISPDLDAIVLRQLMELPHDFKKLSWLFWPGVDGELSPEDLRSKLKNLEASTLATAKLSLRAGWMQDFDRLFTLKIAGIRAGNTIPLAFKVLREPTQTAPIPSEIKKKFAIATARVEKRFPILLDPQLVSTTYLIDMKALYAANPFAQIDAIDALDFFLKVQQIYREAARSTNDYKPQNGSDYLLQYLRLDTDGLWTSRNGASGAVLNIAVTPASLDSPEMSSLLNGALDLLADDKSDIALFLEAQIQESSLSMRIDSMVASHSYLSQVVGKYRVVAKSRKAPLLDNLVERVGNSR